MADLKGKTVVLIGAGGHSKAFTIECAKELGINVVLVDPDPDHFAKDMVHRFLHVPEAADHTHDESTSALIVKRLEEAGIKPDGCLTFWEDDGPLNAMVVEKLGARGNPVAAQRTAKSKLQTQLTVLRSEDAGDFGCPVHTVGSAGELEKAVAEIGLPLVIKYEHGSSAFGVKLARTADQAKAAVDAAMKYTEEDHPGCGLSFEGKWILASFLDGSEHDVDLLMWDGEVLYAAVSDNGPTRLPYFCETCSCMPSCLAPEQRSYMIHAAVQCCKAVGLRNGPFNVEMKYTTAGPKLIEINARMGGFYLRDWIRRVHGIDYCREAYSIACGVRPQIEQHYEPLVYLCGAMMYASQHGAVIKRDGLLKRFREMHDKGEIVLGQLEDEVPEPEQFEEPMANIACKGDTFEEARQNICAVIETLGLNCGDIPVTYFIDNLGLALNSSIAAPATPGHTTLDVPAGF